MSSLPMADSAPRAAMLPPVGLPAVDDADMALAPIALPAAGTAPSAAQPAPAQELPSAADSLSPSPNTSAGSDSFAPRVPRMKPTGVGGARPPSLSAPVDPLPQQVDTATGLGFANLDALPDIRPPAPRADAASVGKASATQIAAAQGAPAATHASLKEPAAATVHEIPPPQAATEKATLKQMAMKGMDDVAGRSLKTAARAFAAILGADGDKRAAAKVEPAEPDAGEAGEEHEELPDEPEYAEGALRPLQIGLSEAVQSAIADALRAYPEVEWACEVSDGTELPLVGVRVTLSFTTRVGEIEAAVLKAARARNASVRVVMLNEPALMREARAHGNTFFPWRKRPPRK